ncbi:MAG: hypothetical protein JXR05_12820 [Flavobacteriaceae bacterium]
MLLPAAIQMVHAFEQHEHVICTSDEVQHIHDGDDVECVLCHLQADSYTDLDRSTYHIDIIPLLSEYQLHYNFFKSHQHLPFSLRGPPSF